MLCWKRRDLSPNCVFLFLSSFSSCLFTFLVLSHFLRFHFVPSSLPSGYEWTGKESMIDRNKAKVCCVGREEMRVIFSIMKFGSTVHILWYNEKKVAKKKKKKKEQGTEEGGREEAKQRKNKEEPKVGKETGKKERKKERRKKESGLRWKRKNESYLSNHEVILLRKSENQKKKSFFYFLFILFIFQFF